VTATATTPIPQPLAMNGIARTDPASRTLTVSRPDQLSGYQKLAWRVAHQALQLAEMNGWPQSGAPFLWAHTADQRDIVHGRPGDNLTLEFHFPAGVSAYTQLVSRPGLSAIVVVDESSGYFTGVKFWNVSR
jgi:hypothetical protein